MAEYKQILKIIQDAPNKQALIERLVAAVDIDDKHYQRQIIAELDAKLNEFKQNDSGESSQRAMHSARLSAMGQMAAAISHELRNPLSGIKVAAEYLMRKLKNHPDAIDIIVNIHNEVIFANNIITNILEHARIGNPNLEKINIKRIMEEAILTIAQQGSFNNIQIKKNISEDLPELYLDILQIKQVFLNMFINAAEAMVGGGKLNIKVSTKKNMIVIEIADTGAGIEKNNLDKLFEPFFSTKVKGVGLGLAISKEIIENHKGTIEVESKLGKGTMFTISLPIVQDSSKQKDENK
ncbi:MAG: ATP-binding protein [Candidatus Omnitrophota bacterium]